MKSNKSTADSIIPAHVISFKAPHELYNLLKRDVASSDIPNISNLIRTILDNHYSTIATSADVYASALTLINKRLKTIETKLDISTEAIFQLVKVYLAHTPSIPEDFVSAASKQAAERFNSYLSALKANISYDSKALSKIFELFILSNNEEEDGGDA